MQPIFLIFKILNVFLKGWIPFSVSLPFYVTASLSSPADSLSSPAQARQYHYILVAQRVSSWGMATDSSLSHFRECNRMAGGETDILKAYTISSLMTATLSKCPLVLSVCEWCKTSPPPSTDIMQGRAGHRGHFRHCPLRGQRIRHAGLNRKDVSSSALNFSFHFCLFPSISALCRKIIFCINKFIKLTYSRMEITGIT